MKLSEEHDNNEQEFRCCPASMDVCAGMVKVTPGGKKSSPKVSKPVKLQNEAGDEVADQENDDSESEETPRKQIPTTKESPNGPKTIGKKAEDQEEQLRRNEVRKRILSTGKLSAGSWFPSPGSDTSSSLTPLFLIIKYIWIYIYF